MGFACAVAGAGCRAAPPPSRATATSNDVIRVSVFIDSPLSSEGLDELADDAWERIFGFAALVVGRLAALAVRDHGERQVRAVLQARLHDGGVLEVVPDDGHGVNAPLLEGRGVEHTARRAGPSEADPDDGD